MAAAATSKIDHLAPQLRFDQTFSDIECFGQTIGWDMDFRQLDAGKLQARAAVIGNEDVQLFRFHFNRGFHQLGSAPEGLLTFGILDSNTPGISWCQDSLPAGSMANFNRQQGFDCVSPAGFNAYAVAIRPDHLYGLAEQYGHYESVEALLTEANGWDSPGIRKLNRQLAEIYGQCTSSSLNEWRPVIEDEIPITILECLLAGKNIYSRESATARRRILEKALSILNDRDELPITVARLCRRVDASASTLKRVFQAEFGVSPKRYIRARCLSAVRDELASAPPGTRVADVANQWGFWHMGQFAADYRKMFGELPSRAISKGR